MWAQPTATCRPAPWEDWEGQKHSFQLRQSRGLGEGFRQIRLHLEAGCLPSVSVDSPKLPKPRVVLVKAAEKESTRHTAERLVLALRPGSRGGCVETKSTVRSPSGAGPPVPSPSAAGETRLRRSLLSPSQEENCFL